MLRSPALLGQTTSGFVPFGAGGSAHGELDEKVAPPALRIATPAAAGDIVPTTTSAEPAAWRQGTWTPAASGRVRVVEAAVLTAIGVYFSFGLVKLAGWV
jgi:hypothetical protein